MSKKTMYFDCMFGRQVYAVVEDGRLSEFNFETLDSGNVIGNIYKGKVTNVLNGMQAAFVNCGLERNCYISVEDLFPDRSKYDGTEIDIPATLNLNVGDEILVQVVKEPIGKKGAKVTTNLSFVGKYTVYMPTTPFIGVSRKIADDELQKSLILESTRMRRGNEGIIVRTASPYANRKEKLDELNYFRKLYQNVKKKFETAAVGELLYSDYPLYMRVLRDTFSFDIDKIYVGNKKLEEGINQIMAAYSRDVRRPVILHDGGTDMFYERGLSEQISGIAEPRVELANGAYLVIEKTEALTVIDVNTGKFTGSDSLEQTVYYTNILAAREIARQVRLRNIGGIVVVDFIDMSSASHQKALVEELEKALESDKAKCRVLPMSKFGLVEFTRKRIGSSPAAIIAEQCRNCNGTGYSRSHEYIIIELRAKLLDLLSKGNNTVSIDLNYEIGNKLCAWEELIDSVKCKYPNARVYVTGHRTYREDTVNFRVETAPTLTLASGTVLLY